MHEMENHEYIYPYYFTIILPLKDKKSIPSFSIIPITPLLKSRADFPSY